MQFDRRSQPLLLLLQLMPDCPQQVVGDRGCALRDLQAFGART
jgi:hypothetical protein